MAFLGLDLGTSSLKALVLDDAGRTLGVGTARYSVTARMPGYAESDPEDWWVAMRTAAHEALAAAGRPRITAIGLCGQMHGVVLTDDAGVPLRPAMLWADSRADAEAAAFGALPAGMRERLANPALPGMAGPMLTWLTAHEPTVVGQARWALQPKDWLRLRLTGEAASDPSDASGTLLFDVVAGSWAADVADATGIPPRLLPPLLASTSTAGHLRVDPFGIGPVPVIVGAADTAAAAVGTGLVATTTGQLSIGTGAQAMVLSEAPPSEPTPRIHHYRAATSAGWYAMAAVQNAGLVLDWARQAFAVDWPALYAQTLDGPRVDGPLFVPFLTPERAHQPSGGQPARFLGLRLHHSRDDVLRSVLEGIACGIRAAMDALPGLAADTPVRLTGGGSLHPGWTHLLADILDRPLVSVDVQAASARGAALLAGVGVGSWGSVEDTLAVAPPLGAVIVPRAERRESARALFHRYQDAWSS